MAKGKNNGSVKAQVTARGVRNLNGDRTDVKPPRGKEEIKAQVLASDPTRDYQSTRFSYYGEMFVQQLPQWRLWTGRMMLTSDPLVNFALNVRNAALMPAEVKIEAKKPQVGAWVQEQWNYLWNYHRTKLVSAKKWGFAPLQIMFKEKNGLICIDGIKDFAPEDCRALETGSRLCGHRVKGTPIFFPQACWLTFGAEFGSPYGTAVLRRQYPAWYEKWMDHGAKRLLQLRMVKDAYIGDIFWYPPNLLVQLPDGTQLPWRDLMREMGEKRLSGGAMTMPMLYDDKGKELTKYTPPQEVGGGSQIFDWVNHCDEGILQGADVPMEVVQAADTGSGYSGRSIPFLVVLSVCTQELIEIVQCINDQVLRPMAWLNFGGDPEYTMTARSLVESFSQDTSGSAMGGSAIGSQAGSPPVQVQQGPPQQYSEESEHDGDKHFNEKALHQAGNQDGKSRETLIHLHPRDFLKLAQHTEPVAHKLKAVHEVLDNGGKFHDVPHLGFMHDGQGSAHVVSHEGRHRAMALHARGVTSMPVVLRSQASTSGHSIRWGSQSKPGFDQLTQTWPKYLHNQNDEGEPEGNTYAHPFPVKDPRPSQHSEENSKPADLFRAKAAAEPGYLYHATNEERLHGIASEGMKVHKPSHGTDQRAWPDGKTEKRSYWSHSPEVTKSFAPGEGKPVLIRSKQMPHHKRESTGDYYTTQHIHPSHLEYLGESGNWHKAEGLTSSQHGESSSKWEKVDNVNYRDEDDDHKRLKTLMTTLHGQGRLHGVQHVSINKGREYLETSPENILASKSWEHLRKTSTNAWDHRSQHSEELGGTSLSGKTFQPKKKLKERYPIVRTGTSDGRRVLKHVPNTDSIGATFNHGEYRVMKGIREVDASEFTPHDPNRLHYNAKDHEYIKKLSADIGKSKRIKPLIVVHDHQGPYVLEGSHRLPALQLLGAKKIPAMVVVDRSKQKPSQHSEEQFGELLRITAHNNPIAFTVTGNPTLNHAQLLLKQHKELRGLHHNGNTYLWDSNKGTHEEVAKKIGIKYDESKLLMFDNAQRRGQLEQHYKDHHPNSQHTEQFVEAETQANKQLREFLNKGAFVQINSALERIRALKATTLDPQTAAGFIEKEIYSVQPALQSSLEEASYAAAIEGQAEVLRATPLNEVAEETEQPTTLESISPPKPPRSLATALGGESPKEVAFPALDDAIRVLERSKAVTGATYVETAQKVREGAFAVTANLTDKGVEDLRDLLADSMREGISRDDFIDRVAEHLELKTLSPAHVENIFRTNTHAALSDGQQRAMAHPLVSDHFPYMRIVATADARTRVNHKALETLGLNGTNIYRANDPTFLKFRGPWDYQCRCRSYPVTLRQAAQAGVQEAVEWLERAEKLASEKGGSALQYFAEAKPVRPEWVTPPTFNPPPEFDRSQSAQFSEGVEEVPAHLEGTKVVRYKTIHTPQGWKGVHLPYLVYHGSHTSFKNFKDKPETRTHSTAGLGHWFSDSREYADRLSKTKAEEVKNRGGKVSPSVTAVHLNIKNPKVYDFHHQLVDDQGDKSAKEHREHLIKQGHDGIKINTSTTDFHDIASTHWVAFHPHQIHKTEDKE